MRETIHIAIAIDDTFLQPAGVMLTSLFENNKSNNIHIYLFSASFSSHNQNVIADIVKKYGQQYSFFWLQQELFKNCLVTDHISIASYYRIVIPQIIAGYATTSVPLSSILYLDADIIIQRDLLPLWKTIISNKVIGAIRDPTFGHPKRLGYPEKYHYFNAGLLLINILEWNKQDITTKLFDYINENVSNLEHHDQDVLNAILYDKWLEISPVWNQQAILLELPYKYLLKKYDKKELDTSLKTPAIIHYSSQYKPWHYPSIHPFTHFYIHYLKMTEWNSYTDHKITPIYLIKKIYMHLNLTLRKAIFWRMARKERYLSVV